MSVKALLATYFRQQKQITMPDLIISNMADLNSLFCKDKKKLHPEITVTSSGTPKIKSLNIDKTVSKSNESVLSVSKTSQGKLASLRKVDQLSIAPRIIKDAPMLDTHEKKCATTEQKRDAMKALYFKGCNACHLANSRTKLVFGSGNIDAPVLIIGEAPGEEEDLQGIPFVGAAGQLLTQMLGAIKIDRAKDTFITNILKCRPPSNRSPESAEIQTCLPFLKRQIEIIQPRAILLLGRIAAHSLLGIADSILKMRSQIFDYNGIPCMVIYHPAALLRNAEYKRPAWEDLQKFNDLLVSLGVNGSL